MRLIDADAAYEYLYEHLDDNAVIAAQNALNEMPTINAACCYMGHWIPGKRGKWTCSCCGCDIYCTSADDLQRNHEFCGHCGAEMKDQCDMRTLIEEAIL